nr:hypothetical protein [uncultured bacterium]
MTLYYYNILAAYPITLNEQFSKAIILGVAPHRVYMISLQPNCTCFLLHWSYPPRRMTGVTRYTALWCPDFPLL